MLLGEWSDREQLDSVLEDLVCSLKSKCKMEIDESVLKVILGGSKYDFEGGPFVTQLCRKKGSYINKFGCLEEEKCMASCNDSNGGDNLSEWAYKLVSEAVNELRGLHSSVNIKPTILVLDYEVQVCAPFPTFSLLILEISFPKILAKSFSCLNGMMGKRMKYYYELISKLVLILPFKNHKLYSVS